MRLTCLFAVWFMLCPFSAAAAGDLTAPEKGDLSPFDRLMSRFLAEHEVPGATLAISKNGQIIYARGFGCCDRESKTPMLATALFRIASISKPITAAAILQLVDRGKLRLTDRVLDVLALQPTGDQPDLRLKDATILHLLQHSGGWDRKKSFDPMFRPMTIAEKLKVAPPANAGHVIQYMMGMPLDFEPGTRYAYSNFGYCLLGRIIEKVSGQPYEAYVRQHVLAPLGIHSVRVGKSRHNERAENEVTYYSARELKLGVFPELNRLVDPPYGSFCLEAMDAHGGWIASAPELVRFAAAFDDPTTCKILRPESVRQFAARPHYSKEDSYYGCGWMMRMLPEKKGMNMWHAGALPGTSTLLVRRHDGLNWAVLFNTSTSKNGQPPVNLIDPLIHRAAAEVKAWPTRR